MNTSLVIGILIFVVTILVSLRIYFLQKKYPGELTLLVEDVIDLFDAIVRNQDKLAVLYDNSPIDQSLVLMKGIVLNTGTLDITKQMTDSGALTMELPEGFKWLDKKITSLSEGLRVDCIIQEATQLQFEIQSTFKRDEIIEFEVLIEVPADHEQHKDNKGNADTMVKGSIIIKHRIDNTRKSVVIDDYEPPRSLNIMNIIEVFQGVSMTLIVSFLLLMVINITAPEWSAKNIPGRLSEDMLPYRIKYFVDDKEMSFNPIGIDKIRLENPIDNTREVIHVDELKERQFAVRIVKIDDSRFWIVFGSGVVGLLAGVVYWDLGKKIIKVRKQRGIAKRLGRL